MMSRPGCVSSGWSEFSASVRKTHKRFRIRCWNRRHGMAQPPAVVYRCQSPAHPLYYWQCECCADVAKLADAQPSEGCDRKVMEVQLLSSAPTSYRRHESQAHISYSRTRRAFVAAQRADCEADRHQ